MYGIKNISENVTTESPMASVLGAQGYTALNSVLLALLVPPQLFLSILTIAGLCTGKTFRKIKAQRNLMISIAAMGFVSSTTEILLATSEYLFVYRKKEAGVIFCHGTSWFYYLNASMRICLLAALSMTVYITVKHGPQKIKSTYINIVLVVIIAIVLILSFPYFIPTAISYQDPFDGVICFAQPSTLGYVGIGLAIVIVDVPAHVVAVGVVIATLVFARKHGNLLTEFKELKMAMTKLTTSLIILNIIVTAANYISFIPFIVLVTGTSQLNFTSFVIATEMSYYFSQSTSAIVSPLVMMVVFKPLRQNTKKVLLTLCCRDTHKTEKSLTSPSESTCTPKTFSTDVE